MTTSAAVINTGVSEMYVTKRNGQKEIVSFDKILNRIKNVGEEVGIKINYTSLVIKVIDQLYDGISSPKIDELLGEQCASMSSIHPDYNILAGRITISNHHKNTSASFTEVVEKLYTYIDKHGKHSPLVSTELYNVVSNYPEKYNALCDYNRDYLIDYFGFKTLERSYLMSVDKVVVERPQHMWLRVSIGIHSDNFEKVCETYGYMSKKYFTHATPTLFNAGTPHPQLSSCYLLAMEEDSIDGIFNTLKDCAKISKWAGGIGLHIHNVRASGSHINGTNGNSNGIVPMLRVFNNTAKYVDQCLHPSTVIYTTHGPIPIAECVPGMTAIFNRTGSAEIIDKVLEHSYYGKILSITLNEMSSKTLVITPEHPIYVVTALDDDTTLDVLVKDLDAGLVNMQWVEAKDLNKSRDYIVYPIPNYTVENPVLTEDICYIYGIILAGMKKYYCSTLSIEYKKFVHIYQTEEKIKILSMFLDKHLINYRVEPVDDQFMLCFKPTTKLPFCMSDFYNKTYIHQLGIGKRWYFLPINKIKRIIDGIGNDYVDSDLQFLKLLAGDIDNTDHCIRYNNNMLVSIKSIRETMYDGILYDLQMTTEHNYLVEGGLVHNGGGKRNGSFAIYLEPWHADVEMFLQMRKNHGDEELKARDLFYALWIPDLFMERVKTDGEWCLMCPDECPGLSDVWGAKFVELYETYEKTDKVRKRMKARDLWFQMMDAQMETGTPYLLYKDACNKKSNQQNIGTIKSSNLCTEVVQYSDGNETAVCNLASIALPSFVDCTPEGTTFIDYKKLHEVTKVVTYNLNRIIEINFYPTDKTRVSNLRHRPIGIGVQGLADMFMMMNVAFKSDIAKEINKKVFETIYHAALEQSYELAMTEGKYETFEGSPASKGILQFDMWGVEPTSGMYDWVQMKQKVMEHGLRNSLLLAPMPTASTSQILGFNECIEPITSNIYNRRTMAGEFILANKYLMNDLIKQGLWNEKVKNSIIANNGSIQHIEIIPEDIREKYRTVWEIPMKHLIDMAADRGVYICQSQSLNLWIEDPNYSTLTSMHFYSWSKGLKTGIYYLRRRGKHQAQKFTIEPEKQNNTEGQLYEETEDEICEMCSA